MQTANEFEKRIVPETFLSAKFAMLLDLYSSQLSF